jgi:hypothetical protein
MGESDKCDEKDFEPISRRQQNNPDIIVNKYDLLELIYWARRYCDGRSTYAPTRFNGIYKRIRSQYPDLLRLKDQFDETLKDKGMYWPYAQDGMYNENTGQYDARK